MGCASGPPARQLQTEDLDGDMTLWYSMRNQLPGWCASQQVCLLSLNGIQVANCFARATVD